MNKHCHWGCSHVLAHCPHCDTVYCTICGKEWGGNYRWYYSQYPTWTTYGGTYSTSNTAEKSNTGEYNNCSRHHTHQSNK